MICTMLVAEAAILIVVLSVPTQVSSVPNDQYESTTPTVPEMDSTNTSEVCLTPGCNHAASEVLRGMDTSVNPCDDFYKYVCGNYIRETIIPDDQTVWSAFEAVEDKRNERLRLLLEEESPEDEPRPFRMAKDLYKSCLNTSRIEEIGITKIIDVLKQLGGWPVLEGTSWLPPTFSWNDIIYKLREEGFDFEYLFEIRVTEDFKNSTRRIIAIDQPTLNIEREYLVKGMNESVVAALYDYMVDMAELMGADRSTATVELEEALQFQIKLAEISVPAEDRRDMNKLDNTMNLNELQTEFPSIPWFEFMSRIFSPTVEVERDEQVAVYATSYIHELEALLSTTPNRVVSNYLLWRVVSSTVAFLPETLRRRWLIFLTAKIGRIQHPPRWQECVNVVSDDGFYTFIREEFSLAVGSLYVKRFFNDEAREKVVDMVNNIRNEMYKILQTVEWMDDETRNHSLEKARSMTSHVGYPREQLDVNLLEDYYQDLNLSTSGDYFDYILNLNKFGLHSSIKKLRDPVNKTDWTLHAQPILINAMYSLDENSIIIPAGILMDAFFSNDRPNYMNYAGIGFIIGHEITHGFDDEGRQYDKDGNLVNWWAQDTEEAYLNKTFCIINQYGNYTVEGVNMNLNGVNSQGENIADNGGLKQAYRAYNQWVAEHGREQRLPGLEHLNPQQLFWVSAANTWCSKFRPKALELQVITGYHSPAEFRINGPMSNLNEFSTDFNCPLGSKMNPVDKCQVW